MKRFFSLLIAVLMLVTLVACAATPTAPSESENDKTTEESACEHVYNAVVTPPTEEAEGYTTHTCTLCGESYVDTYVEKIARFQIQYDDYIPSFGSVSASSKTAVLSGDALEIVTVDGTPYFHAKGIGEVTLTDGQKIQNITVTKAKINLVLVMGQSNSVAWSESAANFLFEDALSDISSPIGTAYHWGKKSTEPRNYTEATRGFHSTLLAELYAQSVAAGDPVKNVLIWENEMTSHSGQSITRWASETAATQVTVDIADMVKKCAKYYTTNEQYYEIVSRGMYWLQGEIDGSSQTPNHTTMSPETYENCFMKMWNKLKTGTGLSYVAFLRVRRDVAENQWPTDAPDHNDICYHTAFAAQLKMIADRDNFYLATTLTEHWVGTEATEHTIDISNYITLMNKYSGGTRFEDQYQNVATYADGKLTTTMKELYGSNNGCHYGKFGYTLIGADAAYNMYRALHGEKFAIVQGDDSGSTEAQTVAQAGEQKVITVTNPDLCLAFRAAPGSTAGKLTITVKEDERDISSQVIVTAGASMGTLNTYQLLGRENLTITVTYTAKNGTVGSVTYTINDQRPQ